MKYAEDRPVRYLKGVGEKAEQLYRRLGIVTVADLLTYYPFDYEDRSNRRDIDDVRPGEGVFLRARLLTQPSVRRVRGNLSIANFLITDETGTLAVSLFNQPYLVKNLRRGEEYCFFGKAELYSGRLFLVNPVVEKAGAAGGSVTGKIVPRYRLCAGLTQKGIIKAVSAAMEHLPALFSETLPEAMRRRLGLCGLLEAMRAIHFPQDLQELSRARRRLAFDELFYMQLSLLTMKERRQEETGRPFENTACVGTFLKALPYPLTGAQARTVEEILHDVGKDRPMNRLVQGDVGCGKTVVAAAAMYVAAKNGFQSALMVPTEILAAQHYQNLVELFEQVGLRTVLLTGRMTAREKRDAQEEIALGMADVVIGTQALIQEGVAFARLGLIVADEQHRFGVAQRASLEKKGENPHVLIMTATPIPRTLSLILYGDLDISVIDELPPGRSPVETFVVGEDKRQRMLGFLKKNIDEGRQVYVVCPLVEESDAELLGEVRNVTDYQKELCEGPLGGYRIGLLHGKMPSREKDAVMRAFADGTLDILVSTTVIEVGVNVPNASVMVVEDAGRFGLAQLHQLRGRVGRGQYQSYCILVDRTKSRATRERLSILARSSDGFYIAEQDLKLRGPGEYFGTRQHGDLRLKVASVSSDMGILQEAQRAAREVMDKGLLCLPEYAAMRRRAAQIFREMGARITLN